MQETVQHQYSNLVAERVTVSSSLPIRSLKRDSKIASMMLSYFFGRRKAEDIGRLIFSTKGFVQTTQGWIVRQQNVHIALEANGSAGAVEEARQT
jgi:hypothetical protein